MKEMEDCWMQKEQRDATARYFQAIPRWILRLKLECVRHVVNALDTEPDSSPRGLC